MTRAPAVRTSRLADLLGALSLAADRAAGQAPECGMAATIMSVRLAEAMGCSPAEQLHTYWACVTRFIGCTSTAPDVVDLALGDDISLNFALQLADIADAKDTRKKLEAVFAPEQDGAARSAAIDQLIELLPHLAAAGIPHCQQAIALTQRLPVPDAVPTLLSHLESRWDGKNETKAAGDDIPLPARIIEFCVIGELYRRAGGPGEMIRIARERAGGQFAPDVCAAFERHASDVVADLDQFSVWELYRESEPGRPVTVESAQCRRVAEVFADFVDNKSGWFVGHSRQVAGLARGAGRVLELGDDTLEDIFVAGLLHDIGRVAVPNGVWDKRGPLNPRERRLAESHNAHSEEILESTPVFTPYAAIACAAHERCDGSGYPRRTRLQDVAGGILAAADVYNALVNERPWREAMSESHAADIMVEAAERGQLPAMGVRAVLDVAGHSRMSVERALPDGLTKREADVLAALARGLTTKEIATRLEIATKTADNHIQKIYKKIGATTRTAAAMYALERGIFSE